MNYLGVAEDHKTDVFIAKFVSDPNSSQWHGYPADQRKSQDIPAQPILAKWLAANVLSPPKVRKIGRGQRCQP